MNKILLLEDDPALGKGLKMGLELEGYQVEWAPDLSTAARLESSQNIDLFILDWNLPDGTGVDFCTKIRTKNASVPILFLTARVSEESAIKAFASGANDFIRKPFGQGELFARVKSALRETALREEQLKFGDLLILIESRKAYFDKREINLKRREFDILSYLVKRSGAVVSRDELINAIGRDGEIFDRTIDSHVSHLRARLKDARADGLQVLSVYGVGYRLEKG